MWKEGEGMGQKLEVGSRGGQRKRNKRGKLKGGMVGKRTERRKGGKGKGARKCGDQKETRRRRVCAA